MEYFVPERKVDDMQKYRRKKIIMAVSVAVVSAVLIILSVCSAGHAGIMSSGEEKAVKQEQSASGTGEITGIKTELENVAAAVSRSPGAIVPKREMQLGSTQTELEGATARTVWNPPEDEPGAIFTRPTENESEAKAHVHAYGLSGTSTVEHPAVTEQLWVEDSPAWDEVVREGYHVSVVTCHECGAQFPAVLQAEALEAWGDHIDAVHDGDGGYDMAASYDVPAEVCHHDATGHYVTHTVTAEWTEYIDTYRCSCGDSYTKNR